MPDTVLTAIQKCFRAHVRYTGDGLPNEPVGHDLPIGDPSSGVHYPGMAEIRAAMISIAQTQGDPSALQEILNSIDEGNTRRITFAFGQDMSGKAVIPAESDFAVTAYNGQTSFWQKLVEAPANGLETEVIKQAADGSWWQMLADGEAARQRLEDVVFWQSHSLFATRQNAVDLIGGAERSYYPPRILVVNNGALEIRAVYNGDDPLSPTYPTYGVVQSIPLDTQTQINGVNGVATANAEQLAEMVAPLLPGDDAILVSASNGAALATLGSGVTRGTFLVEDVQGGLTKPQRELVGSFTPSGLPGDQWFPLVSAQNGLAAAFDDQGRFRGVHALSSPSLPGDWIVPTVIDSRGVTVDGYDLRDGTPYGAPSGNAGGGASVEFVDPGIAGDAWGAVADSNGVVKFMSPMWQGEVIGYEQRGGKVLADTGATATGVIAIGGGDIGQARAEREHPWHVFDETLQFQGAQNGADALASAYLATENSAYRARPTVISLAEVIGSTVETDVLPGAPRRDQLINRVAAAKVALAGWGKSLMVDRIKLSLLSGAPATAQATADAHYAAIGNGLRMDVATATGQQMLPALIVNQSAGARADGTSEVILAEGRLDWEHFALGFIVPTPLYPFDLAAGSIATLTPASAMMVSEMEALAMAAVASGDEWFCPSLEEAAIDGSTITARFATMLGLQVLDPNNHGFTVAGSTITNVTASGSYATITLDAPPASGATLAYAFGQTGDRGDGRAANRGTLADLWSTPSRAVPSQTLRRFARSGRAIIQ